MRIYSDFHDYYDVGLKYSLDEEPVYIRNQKEVSLGHTVERLYIENHDVSHGMVYFVGQYYPFIEISESGNSFGFDGIFYELNGIDSYLAKILKPGALKHYKENIRHSRYGNFSKRESYQEIFDTTYHKHFYAGRKNTYEKMVRRLNNSRIGDTPIIVYYCDFIGNQYIYTDCNLARYHFFKVIEAHTAFHTLQSHLCNIARPENPVVTISDKDLATSKGYNRWTFRKHSKNSKD